MKNYFILFGNCVLVKGYSRSLICDLYRSKYYFIPNELFDILKQAMTTPFADIEQNLGAKNIEIVKEYIDYFIENDLGFYTTDPESFPQISMEWDAPSVINSSIIDFSSESMSKLTHYADFIQSLSRYNCKSLQLRFFDEVSYNQFQEVLAFTDNTRIRSINIVLKYNHEIEQNLSTIINKNKRIKSILMFNCEKDDLAQVFDVPIEKHAVKNLSELNCGNICKKMFSATIGHFTEAQNHSTCLNRKVSIDSLGQIKNCPSSGTSFGSLYESYNLDEIIGSTKFKEKWNISKNHVEVCKDCEFRYICIDCRVYLQDPNNINSKPLKCGYDPYSGEWSDWSKNIIRESDAFFDKQLSN